MIFDIIGPATEYDPITLRDLLRVVESLGGDLDTRLYISADGEPVYVCAYVEEDMSAKTRFIVKVVGVNKFQIVRQKKVGTAWDHINTEDMSEVITDWDEAMKLRDKMEDEHASDETNSKLGR